MIEHKCEQGSAEWFRVRSGIVTASNAGVMFPLPSKLKKGIIEYSTKRADYMYRLAVESILGRPADDIDPGTPKVGGLFWPARGLNLEGEAADALETYAKEHQIKLGKVEKVGFCTTDDKTAGCSPDRWIRSSKTLIEIKCEASWNQAEYLDASEEYWRKDYYAQVQCQLLVTGYQYGILWGYHPRMPAVFRKTRRDQAYIDTLHAEIVKFNSELATLIGKLRTMDGWKPFEEGE